MPMVFSYYNRLSRTKQRIYRQSDAITDVPLPAAGACRPLIARLAAALEREDRLVLERSCRALLDALSGMLGVPVVRVKVLSVRPHNHVEELHGYYVLGDGRAWAAITVWMRTAQRRRVVAFRTFLRTLLHEYCHHLDYELFHLADSLHTEGFYRRESSLFRQLLGETAGAAGAPPEPGPGAAHRGGS